MHACTKAIAVMSLAVVSLLGVSLLAMPVGSARAEDASDFYKGKQITWVLSTGAGGGYASYANAFVQFFADRMPGKPKFVIQYMPGAGGVKAMNYLAHVAPRDGTTIALVHSSVPLAPLYGVKGANFDPRKMKWIGSLNSALGICVAWHTAGIKTVEDLRTKPFTVGSSGAGSQMETMPAMLNKLLGTKMKIIAGYKGGNEIFLAMERGEVGGRCGGLASTIDATRPEWFPKKLVTVPIVFSLEHEKAFPDSQYLGEFVKDDRTRQVLKLVFAPQIMDRPMLTPPDVPADRIKILREAFHAAMHDPRFIAEAKKQHLEINEVSGEKVAAVVDEAFALPPPIIQEAKEAMSPAQ
jgi:tripartite-type tricarboxylate transporter receptor subunit TctC